MLLACVLRTFRTCCSQPQREGVHFPSSRRGCCKPPRFSYSTVICLGSLQRVFHHHRHCRLLFLSFTLPCFSFSPSDSPMPVWRVRSERE
ncbi:hypothetical protein K432DRAFT_38727 [Lepidopterella palustris CBS 459.81]|uniref:Uncharacterized protein n=1 Tax=Lepidopterella palustris CBS 459.81 TaxID=1314670 RepID=A0A8E2JFJ2_9PEZI|nr:hypothetical protein K432DRAFT_38727 [Lepidopterella palustris CBS 459.81]